MPIDQAAIDAQPLYDPSALDEIRAILGDRGVARLFGVFIDGLPAQRDALLAALAAGDPVDAKRKAHSLKGPAGQMGYRRLGKAMQILQDSPDGAIECAAWHTLCCALLDAVIADAPGRVAP